MPDLSLFLDTYNGCLKGTSINDDEAFYPLPPFFNSLMLYVQTTVFLIRKLLEFLIFFSLMILMMQTKRKDVTCYVSPFFTFLIFTSVQTRLIKNFQFQRTTVTARNKRYKPDPVSCIQTSLRISLELTAVISSFKLDSCQCYVFKSPWKFF